MKFFLPVARFIVGVLFIFSGLIKANDPLGLSYKMQEFFEVWQLSFMDHYTLLFSILMISFEIIAGVAILIGWRMGIFSWLLLLLIIFFTFLTGYALFSGKIRECGCFGDCIPLQANQSFLKDLLLLALILIIFPFRHSIRSLCKSRTAFIILLVTLTLSLGFQWYVLRHLPVVDCLPYKKGNNLAEKMKAPPGSIPDSTVILFTYEKNGKPFSFTADQFPADFDDSYKFVKREDKVVKKGNASPAIRDFALQTVNGNDTTLSLLGEQKNQLYIFVKDGYEKGEWSKRVSNIFDKAHNAGVSSFLVTNLLPDELVRSVPDLAGFIPLRADGTAIKTAARHNPTLFLIRGGTVIQKWSAVDFDKAGKFLENVSNR